MLEGWLKFHGHKPLFYFLGCENEFLVRSNVAKDNKTSDKYFISLQMAVGRGG